MQTLYVVERRGWFLFCGAGYRQRTVFRLTCTDGSKSTTTDGFWLCVVIGILNGTLFIRYKIDDDDNNDTDFDTDDSTNTPRSDCCHDGSGRLWSFKNRRTRTRRTRTAALSSTATLNDNYLLHPHYQYQYLLFIGNYSWKNQVSSENCSNINCRYREHHELILNLVKHTLNWIRQQPLSAVPTLCNQYSHSVHYL